MARPSIKEMTTAYAVIGMDKASGARPVPTRMPHIKPPITKAGSAGNPASEARAGAPIAPK